MAGVAAATVLAASHAHAVPPSVTWGGAQNVTGDSDVTTTGGSVVFAYHFGTTGISSTTVNGVTFLPEVVTTGNVSFGNFTLNETPGTLTGTSGTGAGTGAYNALSSGYQSLLGGAAYAFASTTISLTMNSLVAGQQYTFEWWNNVSSSPFQSGSPNNFNTTGTGVNSVALVDNSENTAGAVGQYAIGTFTPASTSYTITFTSPSVGPLINAFELRTVPEPASLGLLAVGGLALLGRRRRS
jgi:hypothetical protein